MWEYIHTYYDNGCSGVLMLQGYYIADVLETAGLALDTGIEDPTELMNRVAKVLNRELPGGRPRVRRKGVKSGKALNR